MARTTPSVDDTTLTNIKEGGAIVVGTPEWYGWLEGATTFAFTGRQGNFTARKERRGTTGWDWKAYRKSAGKLYNAYLGKSEDLSPERLAAVARDLITRDTGTRQPEVVTPSTPIPPQLSPTPDVPDNIPFSDLLLTTKLAVPGPASTPVLRARLV